VIFLNFNITSSTQHDVLLGVYRMFFLGLNLVNGLLCTGRSKSKNLKLSKNKVFPAVLVSDSQARFRTTTKLHPTAIKCFVIPVPMTPDSESRRFRKMTREKTTRRPAKRSVAASQSPSLEAAVIPWRCRTAVPSRRP